MEAKVVLFLMCVVAVLAQPPTGTLTTTTIGSGADLVLVDLNGDNRADALYTSAFNVVWAASTGSGFSTPGTTIATSSRAGFAGDIDGDGDNDVVAEVSGTSVQWFPNNPVGTIATTGITVIAATVNNIRCMQVKDVNNDNRNDVVAVEGATPGKIMVAINDGSANRFPGSAPAALAVTGATGTAADWLVVADLAGDGGAPDIAVADTNGNRIIFSVSPFTTTAAFPAYNSPKYLSAGDINRDGRIDIVACSNTNGRVDHFLNQGASTFAAAVTIVSLPTVRTVEVSDLDGDGSPDLVMAAQGSAAIANAMRVLYMMNAPPGVSGSPVFYPPVDLLTLNQNNVNNGLVRVADVDADSKKDIVFTSGGGPAPAPTPAATYLFRDPNRMNVATSPFTHLYDSTIPTAVSALSAVHAANLLGGPYRFPIFGSLNSVAQAGSGVANNSVSPVGPTAGLGRFWGLGNSYLFLTSNTVTTSSIVVADISQDGADDIVLVTTNPASAVYYRASGAAAGGVLLNSIAGANGISSEASLSDAALGDFDKDGDLDCALSSRSSNTIRVYPNQGGTFNIGQTAIVCQTCSSGGSGPRLIETGDIDRDCSVEILSANDNANGIVLYSNVSASGGGPATATPVLTAAGAIVALSFKDLNNDCHPDIAWATAADARVVLYVPASRTFNTAAPVVISFPGATAMDVGDVTGDALNDLVLVSATKASFFAQVTATPGTFAGEVVIANSLTSGSAVRIVDMNSDNRRDVLIGGSVYLSLAVNFVSPAISMPACPCTDPNAPPPSPSPPPTTTTTTGSPAPTTSTTSSSSTSGGGAPQTPAAKANDSKVGLGVGIGVAILVSLILVGVLIAMVVTRKACFNRDKKDSKPAGKDLQLASI